MSRLRLPQPSIKKAFYPSGSPYWWVTCTLPDGTPLKKKFPTQQLAKEAAASLIRQHHGNLDESEYEEARLAAAFIRSHPREDVRGATVLELVRWAADRFISPYRLKPTAAYVEEFLALKSSQGRRVDTVRELKYLLPVFCREMGHIAVNDFTATVLGDWCKAQKSENKWRLTLKHFFAWLSGEAERSPNPEPVLQRSPIRHWERVKVDKTGTEGIVILSLEQVMTLIAEAPTRNAQRMIIWMLFTGMRPAESVRFWSDPALGWNSIDMEAQTIDVPATVSKVRSWREIRIKPVLKAWLDLYKDHTSFLTCNWRDKYCDLRAENLPAEKIVNDVCRHTWHSFLLASGESWTDVELQAGNTKAIQLKHYARLVRDKLVVASFWGLTPDKFKLHDVPESEMRVRARRNRTKAIIENRKLLGQGEVAA